LVLLRAGHVVELLVDLGQVVGDLGHSLLPRGLRHHAGDAGEHRRVARERPEALLGLQPVLDLAGHSHHHVADAGRLRLHQPVLRNAPSGLLGQLQPPARVGGDV